MNKAALSRILQPSVIITLTAIIAVAAVGVVYILSAQKPVASYSTPTVGEIVQEVDTTGTVKAADALDLSFQMGGQIASVRAVVGAKVGAGQTLATLTAGDLSAQLEQARAAFAIQQAKLAGLQAGATAQNVALSQTGVTNAQNGVTQAKQGIVQASQDAYVKADDAIHNKVDQFISNPRGTNPQLNLSMSDSQAQQNILSGRITMEVLLTQWQAYEQSLPNDPNAANTDVVVAKTRANLAQVSAYLDQVATGLTQVIPTTNAPTSVIQTYQANIATARTNISTDVIALNSAETALTSAISGLASARSQLNVTQAPASATDMQAQQAAVASAQASIDMALAQIGKTVISAPISGTITVVNAHRGEIAAPGTPLISMISNSQFQMETFVSETDLPKIKVGNSVNVTLDAYGSGTIFPAHVVKIDPAATVQNSIASYKVTLQFDQNDPRIQSGMGGSAKIITQTKENALSVPTSAIITRGSSTYVLRQSASGDAMTAVITGVVSPNGTTEITSGLSASDRVRSFGSQ